VIDRRKERKQFLRPDQAAGVRNRDSLHRSLRIWARDTWVITVIQEKAPGRRSVNIDR
jgi:hypothetical protein